MDPIILSPAAGSSSFLYLLNKLELIYLHTVKCFQALLSIIKNYI